MKKTAETPKRPRGRPKLGYVKRAVSISPADDTALITMGMGNRSFGLRIALELIRKDGHA